MSNKKQLRSRWCHPDDRDIIRKFVENLNEQREEAQMTDTAVIVRNFSDNAFYVDDLKVIKSRVRVDLKYAARGNICAPGKNQIITYDDIKKS